MLLRVGVGKCVVHGLISMNAIQVAKVEVVVEFLKEPRKLNDVDLAAKVMWCVDWGQHATRMEVVSCTHHAAHCTQPAGDKEKGAAENEERAGRKTQGGNWRRALQKTTLREIIRAASE